MDGFYMTQRCGAWQVGNNATKGAVEFKIFLPDPDRCPTQFDKDALPEHRKSQTEYGRPRIKSIRVAGSFQKCLGQQNWDFHGGPALVEQAIAQGSMWSYRTPVELPSDFYEYKYHVTFDNGQTRVVGDPCTRYGGITRQNSAFVIGGSSPAVNQIQPVRGGQKHLRDLIVYELMIDDFTDEFREGLTPLDAVRAKLDYLEKELGVNAILFMPWTAWPQTGFSWGYIPHQYFSVEYRYANAVNLPAEKLSKLKGLVDDCHARGIHVIMDGVFNHVGDVDAQGETAPGFPYRWLYQDPKDSPYVGTFDGTFPGLVDLDYHNPCTQEFIRDACFYWMDAFGIDGIRFDNTVNFHIPGESKGLPQLIADVRGHAKDPNFATILEHLDLSAAVVTKHVGATSYWNNEIFQRTFEFLWNWGIDQRIMGALNSHAGLDADRVATTYLGNHDHTHVAYQAGARDHQAAAQWYRVQPYAIALLTSPGSPMIHNGQEFAEEHWLMEDDQGSGRRVKPRPLRWDFKDDKFGRPTFELFAKLVEMRKRYAGLRSDNVYPDSWEPWQRQFNPQGYGVDAGRGLVIFHRWGPGADGRLERFIVVLNFSASDQALDVPLPDNGIWEDLLSGWKVNVGDYWLRSVNVGSNWGRVFFK